jgi:hypothetical protein
MSQVLVVGSQIPPTTYVFVLIVDWRVFVTVQLLEIIGIIGSGHHDLRELGGRLCGRLRGSLDIRLRERLNDWLNGWLDIDAVDTEGSHSVEIPSSSGPLHCVPHDFSNEWVLWHHSGYLPTKIEASLAGIFVVSESPLAHIFVGIIVWLLLLLLYRLLKISLLGIGLHDLLLLDLVLPALDHLALLVGLELTQDDRPGFWNSEF